MATLPQSNFAEILARAQDENNENSFTNLVAKKQAELGILSQQKTENLYNLTNEFQTFDVNLGQDFDADTLYGFGRLNTEPGFTFDAYETAKYDPVTKALLPYLGKEEPTDGSKRSKKWDLHRTSLAKRMGLPDRSYVTQGMLNEEAAKQAENFKQLLYKGQDLESDTVKLDIRKDGVGYFGRDLITIRNPETGEIINEVINTPENNAAYLSNYNNKAWREAVNELQAWEKGEFKKQGKGFWTEAKIGLQKGIDNVQATGYGFAALIVDASGDEELGSWFLKQYLREINSAQLRGETLPKVEEIDWFTNPGQTLSKLGALIGEAMPSIALMMGTGGITGLIAKSAIKKGIKETFKDGVSNNTRQLLGKRVNRSRILGAFAGAEVMEVGGIYGDVGNAGERDARAQGFALLGGTAAAGLELIYPARLLNKFGLNTKAAKETLKKSTRKRNLGQNIKNVGKEMSIGGLTEGTTEALQFIIEETTQDWIKEGHLPEYLAEEFISGILNSFVAGLVPGGALSSTVQTGSELANRIRGDRGAVRESIQEIREKASELKNEYVTGSGYNTTEEALESAVLTLESEAEALGLNLDETYQKGGNLDKALDLAGQLNQIEVDQRNLPVKDRDSSFNNVVEANKAIEEVLTNLNTGSATTSENTISDLVNTKRDQKIANLNKQAEIDIQKVKDKKTVAQKEKNKQIKAIKKRLDERIAKANKNAAGRIDRTIGSKVREGQRKGQSVIREVIGDSTKRINAINKILKGNVSARKRKRLENERNQLGIQIDNISKDNTGNRLPLLPKGVVTQIEKTLNSFEFKGKVVKSKTKKEVDTLIVLTTKKYEEYEKIKNKKDPDINELNKAEEEVLDAYDELWEATRTLNNDINATTDKVVKANLIEQRRKFIVLKKVLEKEFADEIVEEETAAKPKPKAKPKKDSTEQSAGAATKPIKPIGRVLNSLNLNSLNKGSNIDKKGLNETEKQNVKLREKIAKAYKNTQTIINSATDAAVKKTLKIVHNEILTGEGTRFRGIETYLKDAENNILKGKQKKQLANFVKILLEKSKKFDKAYEIHQKTKVTVFIDKKTYKIFKNESELPKGHKKKDYFFIDGRSPKLVRLVKTEAIYVENINELIDNIIKNIDETASKRLAEEVQARNKARKAEIAKRAQETTGNLDDVKAGTQQAPKKPKEEVVEEEVVDVKEETQKPQETKEETKQRRTREREQFTEAETELKTSIKDIKAEINRLKGLEKQRGNLARRVEIENLQLKLEEAKVNLKEARKVKKETRNKRIANNILNKFEGTFNSLKDSSLKVNDLFKIRDVTRKSFFSENEDKTLTGDKIRVKLIKLGVKDTAYIEALASRFDEFKKIFQENINLGLTRQEKAEGVLAVREVKLLLDQDGNMPDDVIFAMLISMMHWSGINQKKSQFRPAFAIAELVFGDAKQTRRLRKEHYATFGNSGIFVKDAAKEIGVEILDLLNISVQRPTESDFILGLQNIKNKVFKRPLVKRTNLQPRLATALGLLSIQTARFIEAKTDGDVDVENGLIELARGEYDLTLLSENPNFNFEAEEGKRAKESLDWNTVYIQDNPVLEVFKENSENLKVIKGAETILRDTYDKPVEEVQETTDDSFFTINTRTQALMAKLQKVKWIGKQDELKIFSLLNDDVLEDLVGVKDEEAQHDLSKDAVKAANREKLQDLQHVRDYLARGNGNTGFYFKYKAQVQHRLRIVSNTINGQRSKIHRALFNPAGTESKIESKSDLEVFKLAVVQAFGYNIKTLKEGRETFELINNNEIVKEVISNLNNKKALNKSMKKLMQEDVLTNGGASAHVLEALVALSVYKPDGGFTTSIGIETDGITNGYAIGLLQFLGGNLDKKTKNPTKLKEALERVGVFVSKKEAKATYEKFINSNKDDVYQAFSRNIVNKIMKKVTVNSPNGFSATQQNAVKVLHGELLDNENALTKFARDLAKTPVMISNYGAGILKVIRNVVESIAPDLYDTLGKHQTAYDNANAEEKLKIKEEVQIIENAINDVLKKPIKLVERLDKTGTTKDKDTDVEISNNLYGFSFTVGTEKKPLELQEFQAYFYNIYYHEGKAHPKKIFESALEELLAPIVESRDSIVRSVEAEFFMFMQAYEQAIGDLGTGVTDIDVKMRIAADLADSFMPRLNAPWGDSSNQGKLIQLIRFVDTNGNRVEVKTKPLVERLYRKVLGDWVPRRQANGKLYELEEIYRIGANTTASTFKEPGVSAVINMVQNMDATVLADLLEQKPEVLPIFDAVISPVNQAIENAQIYNQAFLNNNLNHVFLEKSLEQYEQILENYRNGNFDEDALIETLQKKSFRGDEIQRQLKRLERIKPKTIEARDRVNKQKDALYKELNEMSLEKIIKDLKNAIKTRKRNLNALIKAYGDPNLSTQQNIANWTISQMYMPESIVDETLTPEETTTQEQEGVDTTEKAEETTEETTEEDTREKIVIETSEEQDIYDALMFEKNRLLNLRKKDFASLTRKEREEITNLDALLKALDKQFDLLKEDAKNAQEEKANEVEEPTFSSNDIEAPDFKGFTEDKLKTIVIVEEAKGSLLASNGSGRVIGAKTGYTDMDGLGAIYIDIATITEGYAQKAWTKPKVEGVDALPEDTFKNVQEYINFVIEHERAHFSIENQKRPKGPARENHANQMALKNIGKIKDLYDEGEPDFDADGNILRSIDNIVATELEEVYRTNSLRQNLQAIFEKLGLISQDAYLNNEDKNIQQSHLQLVIDEIISKAGIQLDKTELTLLKANVKAHGEAYIDDTSVKIKYNKYRPESYSEQTAQEVYAHELIHILTAFALRNDATYKQKLESIRNQVKKQILKSEKRPYEIFLNKDSNGNIIFLTDKQAEIDAAKAQYDYVFGDKTPAEAELDEFLAYALTNKFLVRKLQSMDSQVIPLWSKDPNQQLVGKLIQLVSELMERLVRTVTGKKRPSNVEQQIFEMTRDIVAVNQSKRDSIARALKADKLGTLLDKGNEEGAKLLEKAVSRGIRVGSDAWIKMVDRLTREGKINNFLANVLYDTKLIAYFGSSYREFVKNHPKVQEKLNVIHKNFKPMGLDNLVGIKTDLFGGIENNFIKMLYKSHDQVDANRRQYKDDTKIALRRMFITYDDLDRQQKENITRVIMKTDLSVLFSTGAFTTDEILELISDQTKLDAAVTKYRKRLNINKNSHYRLQTSQLANYMLTGKTTNYNQYLNAHNIYKTGMKSKRAYGRDNSEKEIQELDIYISLLALRNENLKDAKISVSELMERELAAEESTASENAFLGLLNIHTAFKNDSLNEGFLDRTGKPSPALMTKGYIAVVTDPDAQIIVEPSDPDTKAKLIREGHIFIGNVESDTKEPHGLYVIYNNPVLTRTKGIISLTSKQFKGTSKKQMLSRNPDNADFIMTKFEGFQRSQNKKSRKGILSQKPVMIPVVDEDLNIVDYRVTLSHSLTEKHLKQDLMFDEVLPTMYSHLQDKIKSEKINREAIEMLYSYGKKNHKDNTPGFVNILDNGRYQDEYFSALPKQAKDDVMYHASVNKETGKEEFWIERKLLDTVFGYVNPSIANIPYFKNSAKYQRYAKVLEKFIKEMVAMAKVNIVLKIPIVPAVNVTSNFVTSFLYGVPIDYILKSWKEAYTELVDYQTRAQELRLLDIRISASPALQNDVKVQNKRDVLVAKMNNSKVAPFIDQGLFTSITEDINQDEFTYRNKIFKRLKESKAGSLVTGKAFDVANHAYLGENTAAFKASQHFLQISDFVARYALYNYQTQEKGISEDKAYKTMIETFVNYDQPLNRYVAYANDIGAILFVKYFVRIQRAGFNLIKEKPLNAGLLFTGTGLLGLDIETILDSSIITGNFLPTLGGFDEIFEEVVVPPGLEILQGEGW